MPNWCCTRYAVRSSKKEDVQKLFDQMSRLECMKKSFIENDFGQTWLGNLVAFLGGDWEKIYCRGSWGCLEMAGDDLMFSTETAWREMSEFRHFVESEYPGMKFYYISEEPGSEYYVTNDADGEFFRYLFEIEHDDEYGDFKTEREARECAGKIIGREIPEGEDINAALYEWSEKNGDYAFYHAYEIIND